MLWVSIDLPRIVVSLWCLRCRPEMWSRTVEEETSASCSSVRRSQIGWMAKFGSAVTSLSMRVVVRRDSDLVGHWSLWDGAPYVRGRAWARRSRTRTAIFGRLDSPTVGGTRMRS